MSTASVPLMTARTQPSRIREDTDVVRQNEEDDDNLATMRELTNQVKLLKYIIENLEKGNTGKSSNTTTIISVASFAFVIIAAVVSITLYNGSFAGEMKNQQTQIEYLKRDNMELKSRLDDRDRKAAESDKQIQTIREMYFLKFGQRLSKGE